MASGKSFLSVFKTILHAAEAAATIAAPILATLDPTIGALTQSATQAAIGVEASITTPGSGAQKQAAVQASTQAVFDVTNQILASQGKPPLHQNTVDAAVQGAVMVVNQLNAVATAVNAAPATPAA